jgi:hypothetical protein
VRRKDIFNTYNGHRIVSEGMQNSYKSIRKKDNSIKKWTKD